MLTLADMHALVLSVEVLVTVSSLAGAVLHARALDRETMRRRRP